MQPLEPYPAELVINFVEQDVDYSLSNLWNMWIIGSRIARSAPYTAYRYSFLQVNIIIYGSQLTQLTTCMFSRTSLESRL